MAEISISDVDQAEAALADAKKTHKKNPEGLKTQARETTEIRRAWRVQEESAGRRSGLVATQEGA